MTNEHDAREMIASYVDLLGSDRVISVLSNGFVGTVTLDDGGRDIWIDNGGLHYLEGEHIQNALRLINRYARSVQE